MTTKAEARPVTMGEDYASGGENGPCVETTDCFDDQTIQVVRHPDGDISIHTNRNAENSAEICMPREQAKEFFTKALEFCK